MPPHDPSTATRGLPPLLLAIRELRWSQLLFLARYQAALRSGWIRRRLPPIAWSESRLDGLVGPGVPTDPAAYVAWRGRFAPPFFFDAGADLLPGLQQVAPGSGAQAIAAAEAILAGRFSHFGQAPIERGFPPDWGAFAPPASAPSADLARHWTDLRAADLADDVKLLWELSRFSWVFPLVRAYRWTGEARFAEACLDLCASWRRANPPNLGPNWISAQEAAIRLLALVLAFHGLWPVLAARPADAAAMLAMIAAHAGRIPATLDYARAQGNNHLLTEAAALLTAGLLFPELPGSARCSALGRRVLESALTDQFFTDGGYVQHSTNYQRLALQAGVWSAALAARLGRPLSEPALESLRRGMLCLGSLADPANGRVPNFGPNDGALLLPLTACEFDDVRPAVQAGARLLLERDAFPPGPWDEEAFWLGLLPPGTDRRRGLARGDSFPQAGLHSLDGETTRGWLRAVVFRGRPGHSDQLHFELWRDGRPLAQDAGTYLYNAAPPWDNSLDRAEVHNTVVVDGREPMVRAGRFLWLDWSRASVRLRRRDPGRRIEALLADHDGYRRIGVRQQRTVVRLGESGWLVVDELFGRGEHEARIGWLLADGEWTWKPDGARLDQAGGAVTLRMEPGSVSIAVYRGGTCIHGDASPGERPTWGWVSPTYACKTPVPFLTGTVRGALPLRITTWWAFAGEEAPAIEWRPPAPGRLPFTRLQHGASAIEG